MVIIGFVMGTWCEQFIIHFNLVIKWLSASRDLDGYPTKWELHCYQQRTMYGVRTAAYVNR